jgi:hypothetical protein
MTNAALPGLIGDGAALASIPIHTVLDRTGRPAVWSLAFHGARQQAAVRAVL